MSAVQMQIGEIAERVGLSLRTIRFYEEAGLVIPDARSTGGFRLYSEAAVARLELIKKMKPLGFSVEEIGEVLGILDLLQDPAATPERTQPALDRLDEVRATVVERLEELEAKTEAARGFARDLAAVARRSRPSE